MEQTQGNTSNLNPLFPITIKDTGDHLGNFLSSFITIIDLSEKAITRYVKKLFHHCGKTPVKT